MKNSGLVSVGHLITTRCEDEIKGIFGAFNGVLASFMPEKLIKKNTARLMFDQFFHSLVSFCHSVFDYLS
jgi:hypothetical protein